MCLGVGDKHFFLGTLVPILEAGDAIVLMDREFEAGKRVIGQMDCLQDQADVHLLLFSPEYLVSDACRHEMERAIALDPNFRTGTIVPVKRVECILPDQIRLRDPLYVDLCDDSRPEGWHLLFMQCGVDLGVDAATWLRTAHDVRLRLGDEKSVNLVMSSTVKADSFVAFVARDRLLDLRVVDFANPATASKSGFVTTMLEACGASASARGTSDWERFSQLKSISSRVRLAILHFDLVKNRDYYSVDPFLFLRYLAVDIRKLVLLIQSRVPLSGLLPREYPSMASPFLLETVTLGSR